MLTQRQKAILEYLQKTEKASQSQILAFIATKFDTISKPTVLRDLDVLLAAGLVEKKGKGRNVIYLSKNKNPFLFHFDAESYFKLSQDQREIKKQFNWEVFDYSRDIFTTSEIKRLESANKKYRDKRAKMDAASLRKEFERLTIELSWKSSHLEGNTYSLFETETLIKDSREAVGHTKDEAIMILNHKHALDYILESREQFRILKETQVRAVHSLLVKDLGIPDDFRSILVRITGTNYQPLDNRFQIEDAVKKIVEMINKEKNSAVKALLAVSFISYTQPFVDGNKRTSRLIANALLLANDWCPMSLRSMDEIAYKKAILLFYEQNSLDYLKQLFIEQFEFAVENYFG
ncbi:MAG: Fic family protein [Candidatus Magasanikbacteria bacterium]|nr:Fic family protein [Candidatus Magasanikbacteria bacterium]